MNRTILIVICDFLLVSLLAFSTVDLNKVAEEGVERRVQTEIATNHVAEPNKDLAKVMRLALDEERKNRDLLMGELERTRQAVNQQQNLLSEREKQLQGVQTQLRDREGQVQTVQSRLTQREQEAAKLQQAQTALQQQYAAAQTNLSALNQQLQLASTDASTTRKRAAELEAELRKRAEEAAQMQQQMTTLARSNQAVLSEKTKLAGQLQVAEVERRHATEMVGRMQEEVKIQRQEKEKLAESFKTLASKSSEIATEIRENRPLAPNMIFSDFMTNRITARITAVRAGALGDSAKGSDTQTVLISDGTNTFAVCHVQETPFIFSNPGTPWEGISGSMIRVRNIVPIKTLSFGWPDPRVVFIPVTQEDIQKLGGKVYKTSGDPYKFQDAVLVGASGAYYGECRFQIDPNTSGYVRLDNDFIKGLFGKFNPSRGDLVFSKQGELLGIMANNSYCIMIQKLDSTATLQFAQDVRRQNPAETLARLYAFVNRLPGKLQ